MSLLIVPTPIGNLEDMSSRAISVLKEADLILAEDTRVSRKLMSHYGIQGKLSAYHQHNEHKVLSKVMDSLESGMQVALVSDAGTPGISDPAFLLIRECIAHNIEVQCLPGPTAFVPALVVSGFPTERFIYEGFLPHKKGRMKRFTALENEERTMVFYESPYRIVKFLEQAMEVFGENRCCSVSREISKLYEEHRRGSLKELYTHFSEKAPKGEFVVVLEGKTN